MPKFLEKKLKAKYGKDSAVPYKIMNSIGAMRGNKETHKGHEMEERHHAHLMGIGGEHHSREHREKKKKKKSFSEALND